MCYTLYNDIGREIGRNFRWVILHDYNSEPYIMMKLCLKPTVIYKIGAGIKPTCIQKKGNKSYV